MTTRSVSEALNADLAHRTDQAAKAAQLLRSAADRLEAGEATETRAERAARLRGSSVLAHTAALELAATSGWLEAFASVESFGSLHPEDEKTGLGGMTKEES